MALATVQSVGLPCRICAPKSWWCGVREDAIVRHVARIIHLLATHARPRTRPRRCLGRGWLLPLPGAS
jgi:hypothetical protein